MPKHIIPPQNSLYKQGKDTNISEFLKAAPFLTFSDKGLFNIAKRFSVTVEELKRHISEFEAKEGRRDG